MNFMAAVTICSDFGTPKIKSVSVSMFPHLLSMKSWEIEWETVSDFIFGAPKSLQMVTAAMKLKDAYSLEENL